MGLKHACGIETGIDTHRFRELSLMVAKASPSQFAFLEGGGGKAGLCP